jgi:hypothetical protein
VYDYINYVKPLYEWYGNYKLLLNKTLINTNIEKLYYNITLDLLLDIENENNKSLIWLTQNFDQNLKKDIWINININYNKLFKNNPYKLYINLLELYKKYPKTSILTYGIEAEVDLNIYANNRFNLNWDRNSTYIWKNNLNSEQFLNKILDKTTLKISDITDVKEPWYALNFFIDRIYSPLSLDDDISVERRIFWEKYKNKKISWHNKVDINLYEKVNLSKKDASLNVFGSYNYWWAWHQDFKYYHEDNLNKSVSNMFKMKGVVRKYFFISDTIINKWNVDEIIDNVNNKNFLYHQIRIGDMNNVSNTDMHALFTDPESTTNIFNIKLEKKVRIIYVKKKEVKIEDPNLEDSTWTQMFFNRKNNPTFQRRRKDFLIEVGAYAELYPKEAKMLKRRIIFDDKYAINKITDLFDTVWFKRRIESYKITDPDRKRIPITRLLKDPKAFKKVIKAREALAEFKIKILSDKVTFSRNEKESPLYEKYKKLDPLNLSGKVMSAKGLRVQWGHNTDYFTFVEKKKKEWKIYFFNTKVKMPYKKWNTFAARYFRRDVRIILKYFRHFKHHDQVSLDLARIFTSKRPRGVHVNLHGHKAFLMQKNLFKNILLGNDIQDYNKFLNLMEARRVYGKRATNFAPSFIYNYYEQLCKAGGDRFIGRKSDLYNFYHIKANKPFSYTKYKTFVSLMRGKGRYKAEYWNLDRLAEIQKYKNMTKKNENNTKLLELQAELLEKVNHTYKRKKFLKHFIPFSKMWNEYLNLKNKENLKDFYNYFKLKRSLFFRSKKIWNNSLNSIGGPWTKRYLFDIFFNTPNIIALNYVKKNEEITWNMFYTQIENVSESLNLNILHKNFYGIHPEKDFGNSNLNFVSLNQLVNDVIIPKNTNILLKKNYIENLINVYENEEKPIINYILYKIRKAELQVLHKVMFSVINYSYDAFWLILNDFKKSCYEIADFLMERLLKNKQIKFIAKYYQILKIKDYYHYIFFLIYILLYCVISSLLIVIMKGYMPKNLIYGIIITNKNKKQNIWEPLNEAIKFVDNINIEDIKKQVYNLENVLEIELKAKNINKKNIYEDILKNIKDANELNIENIKKIKLQNKLKKLSLQKNFFDPENRYIYSWENRYDKTYYEHKNTIVKGIKNFSKIQVYNKFEEKKHKDLNKNYLIFYKKFIFEKNLEKWENNTKFRLEDPLTWFTFFNNIFLKLIKLIEGFKRDQKYNHNRIVFWEDSTLDEWTKITYVYIFPKIFFKFFFVLKFVLGSMKLWNIGYWIQKWKQYVMYGAHTKINYKELKSNLEKEWTLAWFRDEGDYGAGLYFQNMMKIAKKYNNIKKFALNKDVEDRKEIRDEILKNIINLALEKDKLKEINQYLINLDKIKYDRITNNFDAKFMDINKKLILDIDKINPKKWVEQQIKYKYKDIVLNKKLEIEEEEYRLLKQSYTKRGYHNSQDKEKTLQILSWADEKNLKIWLEKQKSILEYEKNLRDYNFKNKIIDSALDFKEARFFESITEYNKDLENAYLQLEAKEKKDKSDDNIVEKKINILYGSLKQYYPYYRRWTTMGARLNYVLAQIIMIFVGWFDNIKKIRKNEFNIQNIFKILWIDLLKYIYKMYWEFIIIWKEYEALKKWGISIKTILKFSLLFTPIIIYSIILYIIFILFFINFIAFNKTKWIIQDILSKIIKLIKNNIKITAQYSLKRIFKLFKEFLYYLKYIWNVINLLFRDVETGNTLLEQLYYKFYNICGKIQRNIFFIKGAFILGYKADNNNNIKKGLNSVKKYIILKYKVFIEQKKKKNVKIIWIKKKENLKIKFELAYIILNIENYKKNVSAKILKYAYNNIIYPIFKIDLKTFKNSYSENIKLYREYKMRLKENFKLLLLLRKIKTWSLIKLIIITILKLLILPFSYIIKYQQNKYIENYKKGIQGFRENPMYLVVDKPKKKNNWQLKLHHILMERKISKYLENLLYMQTHLIEIFFMYKISEVKWTKKNYYQDFFWRKWFWYFKVYKKKIINWLFELFRNIEESYENFEENIETQNWTLWQRCKYAYYMYRMYNHVMTKNNQRRISRDLFFYKRAKERDKMIRIYFFKGIINWITYVTINKVIFVKIKDIKSRKIKHKKIKYYIKNIKATIHISGYIEEVPPQFWALVIIYNKYYKYLLKYAYNNTSYPKKWEANKGLEYKKDYKWRLASPEHIYDIPFFDRRFIAADINSFHFTEFLASLANEPYDPLIRWMLFILEFGMTTENLVEDIRDEGNKNWKGFHNINEVWGDISLAQLLTYSEYLDEYKYEIKEFNRLVGGVDFLKIAENTLERDKKKYYYDQYKAVKDRIFYKNEDILQEKIKRRQLQSAKMLHKALLRNKIKTAKELDEDQEQENLKEYFYVKKREFFEDNMIEKYWDWQAQYDSKIPEDTYYNLNDIWSATVEAHSAEAYFAARGKLINYAYLLDHIVLDSYDETMEEIHSFLMYRIWKTLQKILKKDKIKSVINYKHLVIDQKILSRLNYTEHLRLKKEEVFDKKLKKDITKETYEYIYGKLSWEVMRTNPLYGFIENNYLLFYHEVGDVFTYEDKIQFNVDAIRYQRKDNFHEQEILSKLLSILSERRKNYKNIKKKRIFVEKEKIKKGLNIGLIYNVKWTWEQWLFYNDIDNEQELLNKDIIIFNERYNIWNLKRVPIRIKLPVMLDVDEEYMYNYYKDKSNYMQFFWHRHFLMTSTITPIIKQSLEWEKCKLSLEKHFDKNMQDLIIWLFTAQALNREVAKIKRDYNFVFKNFVQNYGVFHKLYFVGLAHYSWDLIRYHEVWWGEEEFPYDKYFQLKQIEFLNHDPGVKRLMVKIHDIFVDKYKPISYVYFFKYQFFPNYLYRLYGWLSVGCFIWMLKILFYNPAEYLTNHYMFFVPMLLTLFFWYLRKRLNDIRDISKGSEIYLYRYRTSRILTPSEWQQRKLKLDNHKKEWIENFYEKEKIEEVFEFNESMSTERDPYWWRNHSHLNKDNKMYSYKHMRYFIFLFFMYIWVEYWKAYKFKFRNSWWLWDFYRHDEAFYRLLKSRKAYIPTDFKQREWLQDSWLRLEGGGNVYTRWYENCYRNFKKLPVKPLDYGYDWQVERNVVIQFWWEQQKILEYVSALGDAYWIDLGRMIDDHMRRQLDSIRTLSEQDIFIHFLKKLGKRRLKWHKLYRKKLNMTEEDLYLLKTVIKGDLRRIHADHMSVYRLDRWNSMKKDLNFEIAHLKHELKKLYLGKKYINERSPFRKWFEFLEWIEDWYNYKLIQKDHIYPVFLVDSKLQTTALVLKDIQRYRIQRDLDIENIFKYQKQYLMREKDIYTDHCLAFKIGKSLDMRTLLSITEKEKHYHNFYYHFIKYKLDRIIVMKHVHPEYFLRKYKKYKGFKKAVSTKEKMLKLISTEHNYLVDALRRHGRYIKNLNTKIQKSEIIEYKCNLLLNYWKEQKNFWILILDFFQKIDLIEFLTILINLLVKIWG